jgi:regulator of replication initiation timing
VASSSHFQGKEMDKYVFFLTSVVLRAGAGKFVTSPDSKPLQLLVLRAAQKSCCFRSEVHWRRTGTLL